jgi:hypothetical protein
MLLPSLTVMGDNVAQYVSKPRGYVYSDKIHHVIYVGWWVDVPL